ncbi:MAG: type II toxin-antitoxin system RatA family toxin, partial [Pseudomonadota bacterium]
MPRRSVDHHVPYSPQQMFAVVADVTAYPQFVPYCAAMQVKSQKRIGDIETLMAVMTVRYKIFEEHFTSAVSLDHQNLHVDTTLVAGPFRKLENSWRFEAEGDGARIRFYLEYEFRSRLLEAMLGGVFHRMFANFEQAF